MTITPKCDVANCEKPADKYLDNRYICEKHNLELIATGAIKDDYQAEAMPKQGFNAF